MEVSTGIDERPDISYLEKRLLASRKTSDYQNEEPEKNTLSLRLENCLL